MCTGAPEESQQNPSREGHRHDNPSLLEQTTSDMFPGMHNLWKCPCVHPLCSKQQLSAWKLNCKLIVPDGRCCLLAVTVAITEHPAAPWQTLNYSNATHGSLIIPGNSGTPPYTQAQL